MLVILKRTYNPEMTGRVLDLSLNITIQHNNIKIKLAYSRVSLVFLLGVRSIFQCLISKLILLLRGGGGSNAIYFRRQTKSTF